jgi:Family of unknown function (DUF5670)
MTRTTLYIIAVLLWISWIIGFFVLAAGTLVHSLAFFAVIFCLQGIITTPKHKNAGIKT